MALTATQKKPDGRGTRLMCPWEVVAFGTFMGGSFMDPLPRYQVPCDCQVAGLGLILVT